jgi:hypothetical protein
VSKQITPQHLAFVLAANKAFREDNNLESYRDDDGTFFALRQGEDRDCVEVYEVQDCVANFVQQIDPKPKPRLPVMQFAYEMETQLKVNDHKKGWGSEHYEFFGRELSKNFSKLYKELTAADRDKEEITRRCANIANFAMMIADNYGQLEGGN